MTRARYSYVNQDENGDYYNNDVINIVYDFDETTGATPHDVYFYIAEQNMNNIGYDNTKQERIHPENLLVNGVQYVNYDNLDEDNNLKVYTNIGSTYDMGDKVNMNKNFTLTYGDYNTGTSLYEMEVTVKLDGEDKVVATFNTAK